MGSVMTAAPALGLLLSFAMIGVFALFGGSIWLFAKGGSRQRAWLMLAAAGILLANVLIIALPA